MDKRRRLFTICGVRRDAETDGALPASPVFCAAVHLSMPPRRGGGKINWTIDYKKVVKRKSKCAMIEIIIDRDLCFRLQ